MHAAWGAAWGNSWGRSWGINIAYGGGGYRRIWYRRTEDQVIEEKAKVDALPPAVQKLAKNILKKSAKKNPLPAQAAMQEFAERLRRTELQDIPQQASVSPVAQFDPKEITVYLEVIKSILLDREARYKALFAQEMDDEMCLLLLM